MLAFLYPTKKALKENIGKPLRYQETSMFGNEYREDSWLTGVGPSAYERRWYANVLVQDGEIAKVK